MTVWAPFTGSDGYVLREIIDYNETNTDNITVQIDIMDNDTLQMKFATAVSTGTGPSFVLVGIGIFISMRRMCLLRISAISGIRWALTRVISMKMHWQNPT